MVLNVLGGNTPGEVNPEAFGFQPLPGPFSSSYALTDIAYDYAINGIPFNAGESLRGTYFRRMYTREFAAIRKDQFDNQNVPGEQSILGWWLHSQALFTGGGGLQFLDTTQDPTLLTHYSYSEGLDTLSTPGQVSLLQATKTVATGLTGPTQLRGVQKGGVDGVLVLDTGAKTLNFYNSAGAATSYTMAAVGTMSNTFTDDGTNYYYADTTGVWKGVIATAGVAAVKLWNAPSASGSNVISWVKGRLVAGMDNNVYELVGGSPPTLPTPKFSHLNTAYVFSSISEVPAAVLLSGSAGTISQIHKFTIDTTTGALPTMTSGIVTTTMPIGETILTMYAYIGTFVGIGTNKGFRVATTDTNANLVYGPLVVQDPTSVGVKAVGGYDRFLFIGNQGNKLIPQQGWTNPTDASAVDMLLRVDLSTVTTTGSQPIANDLMTTGSDGTITSVCNFGTSAAGAGMMAFATGTKVWITDTAHKQTSGFMYSPKIRYNTLEPKHFKFIYLRNQNITDGSMQILGQNATLNLTSIITNVSGTSTDPIFIGDIGNAQEWLQFKFIMNRGTGNTNYSPVWNGYQVRALPGVNRQQLITLPLICHDHEKDKYGDLVGYDGWAFQRIQQLEAAVGSGNVILLQDLNYSVANLIVIENYRFEQQGSEGPKASSAGQQDSNARGGYILLELRVVQ